MSLPLRVFAWSYPSGNATGFEVCRRVDMGDDDPDPTTRADQVAATWGQDQWSDKAIIVNGAPNMWNTYDLAAEVEAMPDTTGAVALGAAVTAFCERLRDTHGITLKEIWCDLEDSIDYFQAKDSLDNAGNNSLGLSPENATNREALWQSVWDSPNALANLPDHIAVDLEPADFGPQADSADDETAPSNIWNHQVRGVVGNVMIRKYVKDIAESVFGTKVTVSNYNGTAQKFRLYSRNGFHVENGTVEGISSPECYLVRSGTRYPSPVTLDNGRVVTDGAARWQRLIDAINYLISCKQANAGPVIPWVSGPGYSSSSSNSWNGPYDAWDEYIRIAWRMGALRHGVLYFNDLTSNPTNHAADDEHAQTIFESLREIPIRPDANLAEIPLTASEFTIGGVTTKFTQLEGRFPGQ